VAKLAREVTTLDRLTGGRMVLGVGLGAPIADEFGSFGETTPGNWPDASTRAWTR
jgi:alkanesulfonate monooxygenase SsuD/methylene tetrahydromethanopterin reductase-like flavin-dependent oxidoreductase (luciferase family)